MANWFLGTRCLKKKDKYSFNLYDLLFKGSMAHYVKKFESPFLNNAFCEVEIG